MNVLINLKNDFIQLKGAFIACFEDLHEPKGIFNIAVCRQGVLKIASFFKLDSVYTCNIAVDIFIIDSLENNSRFTVIYNLNSSIGNFSMQLITKSNDMLSVISLQSIYPGFN